jgi:hypothetical protein
MSILAALLAVASLMEAWHWTMRGARPGYLTASLFLSLLSCVLARVNLSFVRASCAPHARGRNGVFGQRTARRRCRTLADVRPRVRARASLVAVLKLLAHLFRHRGNMLQRLDPPTVPWPCLATDDLSDDFSPSER